MENNVSYELKFEKRFKLARENSGKGPNKVKMRAIYKEAVNILLETFAGKTKINLFPPKELELKEIPFCLEISNYEEYANELLSIDPCKAENEETVELIFKTARCCRTYRKLSRRVWERETSHLSKLKEKKWA